MKKLTISLIFIPLFLLSFAETASSQVQINGFLRTETGATLTDDPEFIFVRNTFRPDIAYNQGDFRFFVQFHARQDLVNDPNSVEISLRQAYIAWSFDNIDIRAGRQHIVWGRTDASRVVDVFTPMDLSEFLTQDFTDLRLGVTALNISYFRTNNQLQLFLIPLHEPGKYPNPDSRWAFVDNPNVTVLPDDNLDPSLKNVQSLLMWSNRSSLKLDFDLALFYGFLPQPMLFKTVIPDPQGGLNLNVRNKYYRSPAILSSLEYRPFRNLIFQAEGAYWHNWRSDYSIEAMIQVSPPNVLERIEQFNRSGFLDKRPLLHTMTGLQSTQFGWRHNVQYVSELIIGKDSRVVQDQLYSYLSLLSTRSSSDQLTNFRILGRYNFNGSDFWLNPDVEHSLLDGLRLSGGLHWFSGKETGSEYAHLSFSNYSRNSFAYLKLTAFW